MEPKEDFGGGFLMVPNGAADNFSKIKASSIQWRLIWVIIRRTWGYRKEMSPISLNFFASATGIATKHVSPALKNLVHRGIIRNDKTRYVTSYGIGDLFLNGGVPKFGVPRNGTPVERTEDLRKTGVELLLKRGANKEINTKKEKKRIPDIDVNKKLIKELIANIGAGGNKVNLETLNHAKIASKAVGEMEEKWKGAGTNYGGHRSLRVPIDPEN